MNSIEIRAQLTRLQLERIDAAEIGLAENDTYMAGLEEEILECRTRLTIAAVTDRLRLDGLIYYDGRDAPAGSDVRDQWGLHTGLLRADGSAKPALRAITQLADQRL